MKQIMGLMMRLYVGFTKPKKPILGLVLSGEIESCGKEIKKFKTGDQVYGMTGYSFGGYAEYKCMKEKDSKNGCLAIKPSNMSHRGSGLSIIWRHFGNSFYEKDEYPKWTKGAYLWSFRSNRNSGGSNR